MILAMMEKYEIERRECKHIIQREKRKFLNRILEEAERIPHGNSKNFFRIIKKHQHFNSCLNAIKSTKGCIIMEPEKKAKRWREYFIELLNSDIPANPVRKTVFQKAEPLIDDITQDETDKAIDSLKNWKAPGSDNIQAELIKYSGKETQYFIFKVCQKTWREARMPRSWKEVIIIPLHKKGEKTDCANYKGISLLNTAYKVFSKVLLSRLTPYAEECLGQYQCGFRKGNRQWISFQ